MTSKYRFLIISFVVLGLALSFANSVQAQENNETDQVLAESAILDDEPEDLEGVEITEVKSVPSNFGFWWRNIREWTSLALTLDPVAKSEKQLKFAEERMRLANYIIGNSADPKVQEKAQQMLEKANQYMQRIEEKKDDLAKRTDEKSQKLLRNITKHYLNKERVLEKIEDKLPPEKLEEFQELRQNYKERFEKILDDLQNNPNVPQEVKDRVADVLSQAKNIQQAREEFRTQQKDILEEIKAGSQEAREKLEELRQERKQNLEELREQFKDKRDEIIDRIKEGEKEAVDELKELNKDRQEDFAKIREEMKQKAEEIRREIQQKRQEGLKQIREDGKDEGDDEEDDGELQNQTP